MTTQPPREVLDYLAALDADELDATIDAARRITPPQLTRDDLARMKPAEIDAARQRGQFAELLGQPRELIELVARAERRDPITRAEARELNRLHRHDLVAGYAQHPDRITN